jgi:hypothetical protein
MGRVIFETDDKQFRIVEHVDLDADFENLCGDTFNPKWNTEISAETLEREKEEFRDECNREGVYGYVLEKWNAEPGQGYEHIDSCWGFVGSFTEGDRKYHHYIVDEMKETIKRLGGAV